MTPSEQKQLETAERFLVNRHAHVAVAVLRLGEPQFTDAVPTAAIVAQANRVRLYFNRSFFQRLTLPELAGVLAHEALHFGLRHQERYQSIGPQRDRWLFRLSCDAVINDLITERLTDLKLPGCPVTGRSLLGQNVSRQSAEEVMRLLRRSLRERPHIEKDLLELESLDDHLVWDENEPLDGGPPIWTGETERLAAEIVAAQGTRDRAWGHTSLGTARDLPPGPVYRTDLARFLLETIWHANRYDTDWTRPPRKLVAVYPEVILPNFEPVQQHRVLIAIDASGSIPRGFLAAAAATARQPMANATVTLASFDTEVYPVDHHGGPVRGGGGTSVQAVESFIRQSLPAYPDTVFCLTDGLFDRPRLKHPERWVWILTPSGTRQNIPSPGRIEIFATGPALDGPRTPSRARRGPRAPTANIRNGRSRVLPSSPGAPMPSLKAFLDAL